ncbi:MAG: hypothetical protein HEEMFOPI_00839 [Holosporales bacterium]
MKIKYLALALLAATYAFSASQSEGVMDSEGALASASKSDSASKSERVEIAAEALTSASQSEEFMNDATELSQRVLFDFKSSTSWRQEAISTEGEIKFKDRSGSHVVRVHKKPKFLGKVNIKVGSYDVLYFVYQIITHDYGDGTRDVGYGVFNLDRQNPASRTENRVYARFDPRSDTVDICAEEFDGWIKYFEYLRAVEELIKPTLPPEYETDYSSGRVDDVFGPG